jgi:hypothetical protein
MRINIRELHHIYPHLGGLAVSCSRNGFVLAQDRGLGHPADVGSRACARRGANSRSMPPSKASRDSLRSGITTRIQLVVATRFRFSEFSSSLSASAGVRHPRVFLGRVFSVIATACRSVVLCALKLVPFGKYWRSNPLVFSLVPRCHGL